MYMLYLSVATRLLSMEVIWPLLPLGINAVVFCCREIVFSLHSHLQVFGNQYLNSRGSGNFLTREIVSEPYYTGRIVLVFLVFVACIFQTAQY